MQIKRFLQTGALGLAFIFGACGEDPDNLGETCTNDMRSCQGNDLKACENSVVTSQSCSEICGGEPAATCVTDTLSGEGHCMCNDDGGGSWGTGDSGWGTGGGSTTGNSSSSSGSTSSGESTSTNTTGTPCLNEGIPCDINGECCGFEDGDALCVGDGEYYECSATCTLNSQCSSGCCVELSNGGSACVPSNYCPPPPPPPPECYQPGEGCNANGDCCLFEDGDAYCVDTQGGVCAAACSFDYECFSGCCVGLNNGDGACLPPEYCGAPVDPPRMLETSQPTHTPTSTWFAASETESP